MYACEFVLLSIPVFSLLVQGDVGERIVPGDYDDEDEEKRIK